MVQKAYGTSQNEGHALRTQQACKRRKNKNTKTQMKTHTYLASSHTAKKKIQQENILKSHTTFRPTEQ